MTKEMVVAMVKDGKVSVEVRTAPKLNKFARTRDENGKRIPCPFANVTKHSKMTIDIVTPYVPKVAEGDEGEKVERKAWHKPTEVSFIKEAIATEGKFYLFGLLLDSVSEYEVDGSVVSGDDLAEYLPPKKESEGDIWLTIGLDNIIG